MVTDILISLVVAIVVHCYQSLLEVPTMAKRQYASLGDVPSASDAPVAVTMEKYRHEAVARLAIARCASAVPESVHFALEERLILSVPVILYEHHPTRRLFSRANRSTRRMVWRPDNHSGTPVRVSSVDGGVLLLTNRRFIFVSLRRQREYPLEQLAHFSTTLVGVALATAGRFGVDFFTGLNAQNLRVDLPESVMRTKEPCHMTFRFSGKDLEYLVHLLRRASTLPSA